MAMVWLAYLFNEIEFKDMMLPLFSGTEDYNSKSLLQLAKQTMERDHTLWHIMDDLFLGPPFAEEGEEPSPRRLLTMIISQFLQPIAGFSQNNGWLFLKLALASINWSNEDIQLLLSGSSICSLLIPDKGHDPKEFRDRPQDLPWCNGYLGWIDLKTIERLYNQLMQSQKEYRNLLQQQTLPTILSDTTGGKTFPSSWYIENLTAAFDDIVRVLATAHDSQRSLAVALA